MLNFEIFLARHGEFGVQAIVERLERLERYEEVEVAESATLEERWNTLMPKTSGPDFPVAA